MAEKASAPTAPSAHPHAFASFASARACSGLVDCGSVSNTSSIARWTSSPLPMGLAIIAMVAPRPTRITRMVMEMVRAFHVDSKLVRVLLLKTPFGRTATIIKENHRGALNLAVDHADPTDRKAPPATDYAELPKESAGIRRQLSLQAELGSNTRRRAGAAVKNTSHSASSC